MSRSEFHLTTDEDPEYRRICVPALAGFALALAGAVAFLHPLLWVLPVAAVCLCAWGLRTIGSSESPIAGRRLAQVGLALSLLFATSAISFAFSYASLFKNAAVPVGITWIRWALEGKLAEAHQLTLPPSHRAVGGTDLANYYALTDSAREELERFSREPLIRFLSELDAGAQIQYVGNEGSQRKEDRDRIRLFYLITSSRDQKPVALYIRLALVRFHDLSGEASWRVVRYEGAAQPYDFDDSP